MHQVVDGRGYAVVDDRRFGYWAGCTRGADTTDLGIVGVSVRYLR